MAAEPPVRPLALWYGFLGGAFAWALHFGLVYVLTAGGPSDATKTLALDMYRRGFGANQMGLASVIAVILVLVGLAIALGLRRLGGDANERQLEGV